jgi:hypothetical protein
MSGAGNFAKYLALPTPDALGMLGRLDEILGTGLPAEQVSQAFYHACSGGHLCLHARVIEKEAGHPAAMPEATAEVYPTLEGADWHGTLS